MLDAEGNILLSNGEVATQENGWYMGDFTTIEQFIEENSWAMPVNPFEVENGTEFLAGLLTYQWKGGIAFNIDNEGIATVYFEEDEIEAIAAGEVTALNMSGYLTKALLKDAVTIEVSEDGNSIKRFFYDELVGSRTFNYTGDTIIPGNFETNATVNGEWDIRSVDTTSETTPIGLDVDEVLITTTYTYKYDYSDTRRVRVTPVDKNEDGIADTFQVYQIKASYVDDDGVLRDDEGNEVSFLDFYTYEFTSYDGDLGWALDFNPFEIDSALTLVKAVSPTDEYRAYEYVEGVGEISFSAPEKDMEVNTITSFDAYVEESDDTILEDADNFIDVNAALTLEAILGEYDVKAQLSGKRTGLDDGKFDLELTYSLPGEDAQRSFTVQANTEQEGKLTAKNTEGVVLVLEEPAEDTEGTQVIGKILVGPTAIQAATIEDRDGIIVIVYSDDDEDAINEVETL